MVNSDLNYKHLRYFWTVARVGTIAEAGRVLGLAPHSISAQLATFEGALGGGDADEITQLVPSPPTGASARR